MSCKPRADIRTSGAKPQASPEYGRLRRVDVAGQTPSNAGLRAGLMCVLSRCLRLAPFYTVRRPWPWLAARNCRVGTEASRSLHHSIMSRKVVVNSISGVQADELRNLELSPAITGS